MFLGEYSHNLDSKGRLTIPAKYREQLEQGMVVTRNPTANCLLLMPLDEWARVSAKVSALPLTDPRSALLRRALFSAAEDLSQDKQGRILISQRLREYARIETEIVVAGVDTHIELWNPGQWQAQVLAPLERDDLDGAIFEALGV